MMMRRTLPALIAVALLLAAGLAAAGEPKTALGKWMVPNMGTAFAGKEGSDAPDFATLQKSYTLLLTKEPPAATYAQWDGFLRQGLTAANGNDKAGVQASCKGCHKAHRDAYKADASVPKAFP
jgi:hypothetical protein